MKIRLSKNNIWIFLYIYLTFQSFLQSISHGTINTLIKYSDDFLVLLLLIALIITGLKKGILLNRDEQIIIFLCIIFEMLGVIFGAINTYQKFPYVLLDAFTCSKFLIIYFAALKLTSNKLGKLWMLKINRISRYIAVILFILTIHDLLFKPYFTKAEFRYFTYSIKLFFTHPEGLARACAAFIFPLAYNMKFCKGNMKYILLLACVMLSSFRAKAIAAALVVLIIYFYKTILKGKHISVLFVAIGIVTLFIGYDQIVYYYSHELISRTKLLTDSIIIASDLFPIGSGFGSFSSNVALDYHSVLYEIYGYFNESNPWAVSAFLNDAFWPIIIAQVGWIGTAVFIIMIALFIRIGIKYYKKDFYIAWVFISVVVYDLISTLASSAFFHPLALSSYLLLGLMISSADSMKIEGVK